MPASTESFRIKKALLEDVRKVADETERSIQVTIERWIREGLAKYQEETKQWKTTQESNI